VRVELLHFPLDLQAAEFLTLATFGPKWAETAMNGI